MAEKKRFLLRIDPQVYDAIVRWASDDLRSVNAQMEFLLQEAARKVGRLRPGRQDPEGGNEVSARWPDPGEPDPSRGENPPD